ncbi:MAG: tetratricopeptide repeat protein [Planctomycetaceae bacterium]|jgi:tetratricopeptide (TPR) repeat protein|nr:tetratricopeptide repeat protein [Planctomycetaceae bacterium]
MHLLSKIISIIFIALWMQFVCDSVVSQSTILSGNNTNLSAVQNSPAVFTETATNKQVQYYQNQYANKQITSNPNTKPKSLMGGYPNNVTNNNLNGENVHVAANSISRSMLPTSPTITSPNPNSNSLNNVDTITSRAVNNNVNASIVSPPVTPKSRPDVVSTDSIVKNRTNPPTSHTIVSDSNVITSNTRNETKIEPVNVNLSDTNLLSSDSSADVVKPDSRLKPTESMQDMLLNPQKLKSFLPSFLFRKKIDDPLGEDDGLETVNKIRQVNATITEQMYIESVTKSKSVVSTDIFVKAMSEDAAGNYIAAIDLYKEFIKLNSKRTTDGTLAAPYHRLALILWMRQHAANEADVCFRYALKYAKEGIVQVVVNDYNNFLTEYGKLNQAESILRNTISFFPHDPQLKVELGRCLARQDRPIEALRHIRPVLGEAQAYVELANIYRDRGDLAMSDVLLQRRNEFIAKSNQQDRTIASMANNNNNVQSRHDIGSRYGATLPATGQNFSRGTSNNSSDLPVDPFNIVANSNEIAELGEGGWQGLNNPQNNLSNKIIPVTTNQPQPQSQTTELKTSPAYKISGYHYSVEDVAPIFLQY